MVCTEITQIYFSPNGTTRQVVEQISQGCHLNARTVDLLRCPVKQEMRLPGNTLVIVGMPVYTGRIPTLCREMLLHLKGENTPVILAAVYGNRDYDDALIEMRDLFEANGFVVVGAGAFIAQHSIFPQVGANRPDEQDIKTIQEFSSACSEILSSLQPETAGSIQVKGNPDYCPSHSVPLKPSADKRCTGCGKCAALCPTGSIPVENPRKTCSNTCISCGACIHVCPVHARGFHDPAYQAANQKFCRENESYRHPELFYLKQS